MEGREMLIALAIRYLGEWRDIADAVRRMERISEEDVKELLGTMKSKAVTILDPDYPSGLKEIYQPPFVLFYYGDLSLAERFDRIVAIVGSRDATDYGKSMAYTLAKDLSEEGFSVVSGLAYGIDTEAARGAVKNGKAIAVLGNGIEYFYPSSNSGLQREIAERGLLLSEYPGYTSPSPDHFPTRNRIVAGLGTMTIAAEAKLRSGTMVTAAQTLAFNRNLGCVPYHADEESACNLLLKEGACLVESASDVYDEIGYIQTDK